jgi:hypothetical protein
MKVDVQASASPRELLEIDAAKPENRLFEHPTWRAVLDGSLQKARLKKLLLAFYPVFAGPGRYAFAAKVSQIDPQDGKQLFLQIHESLKNPVADADAGWKKVLVALGATAARSLFGRPMAIGKNRGRELALADGTAAFITIHPSALLRIEEAADKEREYRAFAKDLRNAAARLTSAAA